MKLLKIIFVLLVAFVFAFEVLLFATQKTYINRTLWLTIFSGKTNPDIDELNLFPSNTIAAGKPQAWPMSSLYNKQEPNAQLQKAMESYQTVAFVVIKNDSVLYEKYWENYSDSSNINSFSMAKSITALLIGCAIKEGLIKSVNDPVSQYINVFKQDGLAAITIKHLLTMSSGLDFKENYASPLAWPAEAYYGSDVNALTLKQSLPLTTPGKIWFYKGGDTQLLGIILKKVTGKTVAAYASEKLWQPIGAERAAYWSLDDNGMEKVSCCWYTNAKDFARIAKLMLNCGKWNDVQLIDSSYVAEAITPAPLVDEQGNPSLQYGFQWWLMNYKNQPVFYARGIRGQYIFALPQLNTIVVRLGHKRAKKEGHNLPADIYVYLDAAMQMVQK